MGQLPWKYAWFNMYGEIYATRDMMYGYEYCGGDDLPMMCARALRASVDKYSWTWMLSASRSMCTTAQNCDTCV